MKLLKEFSFKPITLVPGDTIEFTVNLKGLHRKFSHECTDTEIINYSAIYRGRFKKMKAGYIFTAGEADTESMGGE